MSPYFEGILLISIICAIGNTIPTSLNLVLYEYSSPMQQAISSEIYRLSLVAALASSGPVIIDTILDGYKLPRNFLFPKWLLLSSLTIPNALMLWYHGNAKVFMGAIHAREIMLICSLLSYLISDRKELNLSRATCAFGSCFAIAITSNHASGYIQSPTMLTASLQLSMISLLGIVFLCGFQFRRLYSTSTSEVYFKYTIVYTVCLCFNLFGKWTVYGMYGAGTWVDFSGEQLSWYTFLDTFTVIIASTIPGRFARHEATLLQTKLEAKKNFVRYISHEIRTPLNTVYMGLQLLTERVSQSSAVAVDGLELCNDLQSACSVAIEMLNDLLLFDKIEEGNVMLERKTVEILQLLNTAVSMFSVQAQACGVNLVCPHQHDPVLRNVGIHVDVKKFSQIIRNVVSNALKFSPTGGTVSIHAYLKPREEEVRSKMDNMRNNMPPPSPLLRIEVKDCGPGLTMDQQERLFKEIVQFNAADLQDGGGSGLGMWISKGIMDKHGGIIGVESTGIPGEGSTFYIELDAVTPVPVEGEIIVESKVSSDMSSSVIDDSFCMTNVVPKYSLTHRRESVSSRNFSQQCSSRGIKKDLPVLDFVPIVHQDKPLSVPTCNNLSECAAPPVASPPQPVALNMNRALIVDDSVLNRKMLKNILKRDFVEIVEAEDGIDAIEKYEMYSSQGAEFDAIFMDDGMPRMLGRDAIHLLRNIHAFTHPIIAITGNVLKEDIDALIAAGANAVCEKPLNIVTVRDILRSSVTRMCIGCEIVESVNSVGVRNSKRPHFSEVSFLSSKRHRFDVET